MWREQGEGGEVLTASSSQRCDAAVYAALRLVHGVWQGRQSVSGAAHGKAAGLWLALLWQGDCSACIRIRSIKCRWAGWAAISGVTDIAHGGVLHMWLALLAAGVPDGWRCGVPCAHLYG